MNNPTKRRAARGSGYEKVAISLPRETARRARAEAVARGAPSLSAFITAAVEETLERDDLRAVLDGIFRDAPMSEEERAWADRALGLD
jgi:predicted subunit of tRNA(5-methylaminomethyl-2-thiouridylate) methyltransferase